jgi:hypothetical protein
MSVMPLRSYLFFEMIPLPLLVLTIVWILHKVEIFLSSSALLQNAFLKSSVDELGSKRKELLELKATLSGLSAMVNP